MDGPQLIGYITYTHILRAQHKVLVSILWHQIEQHNSCDEKNENMKQDDCERSVSHWM